MSWTVYNSSGQLLQATDGISNVLEDTTPQLGGNLDMQARLLVGNGGTTGIAVSANGEVTMAAQPAFLAHRGADLENVTGDGTVYPASNGIVFNTEIFDQNSDYNNSTGQFTAPVTGKYQINTMIRLLGLTTSHTVMQLNVVSSNRTYTHRISNICAGPLGALPTTMAQLIDMDAADTVHVTVSCAGSSKVVDIQGDTAPLTNFSGYLVA